MSKPTLKQLRENTDEYEEVVLPVKFWRRKSDGNLFFKSDTNGKVYDKYVQIQDQAGVAVVTHRRSSGSGLGGRLLRLGAAVLSLNAGIPVGVAKSILRLPRDSEKKIEAAKDVVDLIRAKKPRDAVLRIADAHGAEVAKKAIESYSEEPDELPWAWGKFFDSVND